MAKGKKQIELDDRQLGFDFDSAFSNTIETIERVQEEAALDPELEGVSNDRRPTEAAGNSGASAEAGNATGSSESAVQPTGLEDRGSLGNEFTGQAQGAGSAGANSDPGAGSGATAVGNGSSGESGGNDASSGTRNTGNERDSNRIDVIPSNYVITGADRLGQGGAKAKYRDNVAALKLLKSLQEQGRAATTEEQAVLVKYVGWGGIPQAFDHQNNDWRAEFQELSGILSKDEYEAARRSTQDAHYTSQQIIGSIYNGLDRLGFKGGRILESAVGTGNFIGLMPEHMREKSNVTGIELDQVTAQIAKLLYPNSTIINKGYQDVTIPANYFDVAVGNPPFGSQHVYDPQHRDLSDFSIHNYFLSKNLDKLRQGGIEAVVVSSYYMDAQSPAAREWMAERAHLLGAIRLPNSAFKENALTEVTTDILFFQKARENEIPDKSWTELGTVLDEATGKEIPINKYFISNPSMILGKMALTGTMYRSDMPTCEAIPGFDLEKGIADAIAALPMDRYTEVEQAIELEKKEAIEIPPSVKIGAFFMANGRLARRLPDLLNETNYEWVEAKNARAEERIKGMIEIRTALRDLMTAERSDDTPAALIDLMRDKLNKVYDQFVKQNGYITSLVNKQAMRDDPDYPLLLSLERDYDKGISAEIAKRDGVPPRAASAKKASIFSKRVMLPQRTITSVGNAKEAMVVSLNEYGRIDLPFMLRLSNMKEEALLKELDGLIYLNPKTMGWESADQYLTGNVKLKLKEAESASANDSRFAANVEALRGVQPADIDPVDIGVQLGSTWVPAPVVHDFVGHLLGNDVYRSISYQPTLGKWITSIGRGDETTATVTWGTADYPAHKLIEAILVRRPIEVKEEVGRDENNNPIYRINEEKTAVANQKADEIKQAFEDWIWEDKTRRESLGRLYNDTFNTNVIPTFDGSHLTLPGASVAIALRKHQKDAIWRGIQQGGGLLDHRVGAGKTFEMIGIAMEMRRMGLVNKPMFNVPNHLTLQWKDAFYELYPNANVLVAEKSDFTKENREKLFAKIATGDWDAVIVGHSSMKKIGMPEETLNEILEEQINDLTQAVLRMKADKGDRITIKEMEKARDRMQAKLERAADTGAKDKVVTFDELGVDLLITDESQEFKNLFINTSMSRIAGLGNLAGSDKAFDLFVKQRYLQKENDGRGTFFGTGTPLSNTIAEMFTLQRYMQYDDLKSRGLEHFDAWASTFGRVVTGFELDATGVNYKINSRFAKFQNVPELISMYRTFADVITKEDLIRQAEAEGKRFPVPKIKGEKPINVIVERSELQAQYMGVLEPLLDEKGDPRTREDGSVLKEWNKGSIIHRMENLPDDPREDNPLKITNDARKAGLDFRLINPHAPDFEGSKVNVLVDNVVRIAQEWESRRGTQLIFCDLSTPKSIKKEKPVAANDSVESESEVDGEEEVSVSMDDLLAAGSSFSVYDDIKAKLIAKGIPENEIKFIHEANTEAQKAKLFADMNAGRVRVLLGTTIKMGAGTNVQKKLVAKHDLDAPWRPSDLEQRDGRIERQGNEFYEADPDGFEIEMYRYATKQTYDARMWQTIEYKAAGIEQFRKGDSLVRVIDDIASEAANAAEMKAAASGNPLIFMQVQISADLKKVEAMYSNHKRNQHALERNIDWLTGSEERAEKAISQIKPDIERRDKNTSKEWKFIVGNNTYTADSKDAMLNSVMAAMQGALEMKAKSKTDPKRYLNVGKYRGFQIDVRAEGNFIQFKIAGNKKYEPSNLQYHKEDKFSIGGFLTRLDNFMGGFEDSIAFIEQSREQDKVELEKAKAQFGKPFADMDKLEMLRRDASNVMVELKKMQADDNYVSTWKPESSKPAAQAKQEKEAAPQSMDLFAGDDGGVAVAVESPAVAVQQSAVEITPAVAFDKLPPEQAVAIHPGLEGAYAVLAKARQVSQQTIQSEEDRKRFLEMSRERISQELHDGKTFEVPELKVARGR